MQTALPFASTLFTASLSLLSAQSWSITGQLSVPATASCVISTVTPAQTTSNSVPAGYPVTQGLTVSASGAAGTTTGSVSLSYSPSVPGQIAPLGFRMTSGGSTSIQSAIPFSGQGVSVQADATLLLHITAPAAAAGRLFFRSQYHYSDLASPQARVSVDLGADGSWEVLNYQGFTPGPQTGGHEWSIPCSIPAAGLPVSLHLSNQTSCGFWLNPIIAVSTMVVDAQFFPDQPVVSQFQCAVGAFALEHRHSEDNHVTISMSSPFTGLLVFGAQPLNVPAPGIPNVTQLVSIDAVVFASSVTLPLPFLPHGSALYAQGLAVEASGTLRSSCSIRADWP